MPRYFFNVVDDSKNVAKDNAGVVLPGVREARKEAVGLASDFVKHGFRESTQTWKVVVTDEIGAHVVTVALSEISAHTRVWLDLRRRFAAFESSLGARSLAWLIAAAVMGIIVQASIRREVVTKEGSGYQTASAPTGGAIVAVRFAPQASAADITNFLDTYNASLVGGPRPAGLYRLLIGEATMPQEELAKVVGRMARESIIEFAEAVQ
jgi:hypothetical protein